MLSDTPTVLRRICDRKLEEIQERKDPLFAGRSESASNGSAGATWVY